MKKPAKSNMYSYASDAAWDLYAAHLDGAQEGPVCVVSAAPLGDQAVSALERSFSKLGYGNDACCFVHLRAAADDDGGVAESALGAPTAVAEGAPGTPAAVAEGAHAVDASTLEAPDAAALDAPSLMNIIEALDPRVVVACDDESSRKLEAIYRQEIGHNATGRLLGRTVLSFDAFETLLQTPQGKQQAWALLKKLPH